MSKIKKYSYSAYSQEKVFHSGELNANSVREAYSVLQNQGLIAFELKEVETSITDKIIERIEQFKIGEKWTAYFIISIYNKVYKLLRRFQ